MNDFDISSLGLDEEKQKQLESFLEGLNIKLQDMETKNKKLEEDHQKEIKQLKIDSQNELKDFKFDIAFDKVVNSFKCKDGEIIKKLANIDSLKNSDNYEEAISKFVESVKENKPYMFETEDVKPKEELPKPPSVGKLDQAGQKSEEDNLFEEIQSIILNK